MLSIREIVLAGARLLAIGLFLASGIDKLCHYNSNEILMAEHQVPGFFLPLVILLEVGGSLAIAVGFLTRFTSIFMALLSILAGFLFYQGFSHEHLMLWLKNASCASGFILLAIHGPGRLSLEYWLSIRRVKKS